MILKAVPAPTSPQRKMPWGVPMCCRYDVTVGKTRSETLGLHPTMNVSVPAWAPMGPPVTGASTKVRVLSSLDSLVSMAALAMPRMVSFSMVPHSIINLGSFGDDDDNEVAPATAPARTPVFGSRYTALTAS